MSQLSTWLITLTVAAAAVTYLVSPFHRGDPSDVARILWSLAGLGILSALGVAPRRVFFPKDRRGWSAGSVVLHGVYGAIIGLSIGLGATGLFALWITPGTHQQPRADVDSPGDWSGLAVVGVGSLLVPAGTVLGFLLGLILAARAAGRERRSRASRE